VGDGEMGRWGEGRWGEWERREWATDALFF